MIGRGGGGIDPFAFSTYGCVCMSEYLKSRFSASDGVITVDWQIGIYTSNTTILRLLDRKNKKQTSFVVVVVIALLKYCKVSS